MNCYTKDFLIDIVQQSSCLSEVLRKCGLRRWSGASSILVQDKIRKYKIDTSHFSSSRKGGTHRLQFDEVLVHTPGKRVKAFLLRRALIESGVPEICEQCGQKPYWNGKPLRLQVDHKDGNPEDHRPNNVRFLCPNCHSQTENHSIAKHQHKKGSKERVLVPCFFCKKLKKVKPFVKDDKHFCNQKCYAKQASISQAKIEWPTDRELQEFVNLRPMTQIAISLGVSDKAIKKRCRKHGIITPGPGYWTKRIYSRVA